MADFNESLKAVSLAILRRELSDEERTEFLELGAALGMNAVEDYLYILMIFKRQSDALGKRFDEISGLERKINGTLEKSVERILGEGAARIGADMGNTIAARSREIMSSVKEFHLIRGYIVATAITGIVAALAYWFGFTGGLRMDELGGPFMGVLLMPAGWWMLVSLMSYTYFWCFDNWKDVKSSLYHQCLLAFQVIVMFVLLELML